MAKNTILITGGATGIGYALMERYLDAGDTVIICGRRKDKLEAAQQRYPQLHIFACDLSQQSERELLVNYLAKNFPKLNMLINNAGISRLIDLRAGVRDLLAGANEIAINFEAPVYLKGMLMKQLLSCEEATIINISSPIAQHPLPDLPLYSATKAGFHTYTMVLREQLAATAIKVIEVSPPAVASEINLDYRDSLIKDLKLVSPEECVTWIFDGLDKGLIDIKFTPPERK
jgi:uncharacterized oxidoreductase